MGGHSLYFGKPHPPIYDLARRRLSALPRASDDPQVLAVGDGITTDIQGAMGEGIDSIFITGGIATEEFGSDFNNPDKDLLEAWLSGLQMNPTYALGRLR